MGEPTKSDQNYKHPFGKNTKAKNEGQWQSVIKKIPRAKEGIVGGKEKECDKLLGSPIVVCGPRRDLGLQLRDESDSLSPTSKT